MTHAKADRKEAPVISLDSFHSGFAETRRMPEALYLGRSFRELPLKWLGCGCRKTHLVRIPRAPWMRLLPRFRQYCCLACGASVLRPRMRQRHPYGAVYLPAAPVRYDARRLGVVMARTFYRLTHMLPHVYAHQARPGTSEAAGP